MTKVIEKFFKRLGFNKEQSKSCESYVAFIIGLLCLYSFKVIAFDPIVQIIGANKMVWAVVFIGSTWVLTKILKRKSPIDN